MAYLALARHGESEWNAKNLWTGWEDKVLTRKGFLEARKATNKLKNIKWNIVFESDLQRVKETAEVFIKTLKLKLPVVETAALRERNYGIYTERNKDEVRKELGNKEFEKLHRGWNYPIKNGESLKQVYERVVPYYEKEIEPRLKEGQNVVVFASGNSLRALYKYLKNLSNEEIEHFEIPTGDCILLSFPPDPARQI